MRSPVLKSDGVREVALGDLHVPEEDGYAWELACRCVEDIQPARVILLGDMVNFDPVSRWRNAPDVVAAGLQPEIDRLHARLAELRSSVADDCRIVYIPGNHEQRLEGWLMDHPGLHGLHALRLPALLELDRFSIEFAEGGEVAILPSLLAKHGSRVRRASGASALAELQDEFFAVSVIHGHTHRLGAVYATTRNGLVAGYENGCLCTLEPHYLQARPNWQRGFSVITHWRKEAFHVDQVPFLGEGRRMKAVVMGGELRLGR